MFNKTGREIDLSMARALMAQRRKKLKLLVEEASVDPWLMDTVLLEVKCFRKEALAYIKKAESICDKDSIDYFADLRAWGYDLVTDTTHPKRYGGI